MPPKKPAADSAEPPMPSSSDAPVEKKKPDAATLRKLATHPSTAIMVKEALEESDSRKGLSSQAIQSYIKQKYPSVDLVRLKHLVRRALKKGLETGTLVRPANSKVTTGAMGKFKLAPKVKEAKPTTENEDPNVETVPKAAKKPKKAGVAKKEDSANEEDESKEEHNPPKRSKKVKEAATSAPTTSKVAPAKKPKARKAAEKDDGEGAKTTLAKATKEAAKATKDAAKATKESTKEAAKATKEAAKATKEAAKATKESTKEAAKSTKESTKEPAKATKEPAKATKESTKEPAKATKEAKAGKAPQSKAAKASSDAPAAKATGKRGRKTAE